MPRIVEQRYETPDGAEIVFDCDICGERRKGAVLPGPVSILKAGKNRIRVWDQFR